MGLSVNGATHDRDREVEAHAGAERHLASDREAVLAAHRRLVAAVNCGVVHDRRGRIDRRLRGAVQQLHGQGLLDRLARRDTRELLFADHTRALVFPSVADLGCRVFIESHADEAHVLLGRVVHGAVDLHGLAGHVHVLVDGRSQVARALGKETQEADLLGRVVFECLHVDAHDAELEEEVWRRVLAGDEANC